LKILHLKVDIVWELWNDVKVTVRKENYFGMTEQAASRLIMAGEKSQGQSFGCLPHLSQLIAT
jgi:hypothetical protein